MIWDLVVSQRLVTTSMHDFENVDSKSCGLEAASDPEGSNLARKRASFLVRLAPLAQWQSSGLLTRWFRVRPPGGALRVPVHWQNVAGCGYDYLNSQPSCVS